jgi:hypothetical protein
MWAWRDLSALETVWATISLIVGAYLCSPSVYFFAKQQKGTVGWKESLLFAAACLLLLCNIAATALGFWGFREARRRDACRFADQATQHIYIDHNRAWTMSHVTQTSLAQDGSARLEYFFEKTKILGEVRQVRAASGNVRLRFHFPFRFESDAHVTSRAETEGGSVTVHFILWNSGDDWKIHHMWWDYLPVTGKSSSFR